MKCCFCKKDLERGGNNAQPVMEGRCCSECNMGIVLPIKEIRAFHESKKVNNILEGK